MEGLLNDISHTIAIYSCYEGNKYKIVPSRTNVKWNSPANILYMSTDKNTFYGYPVINSAFSYMQLSKGFFQFFHADYYLDDFAFTTNNYLSSCCGNPTGFGNKNFDTRDIFYRHDFTVDIHYTTPNRICLLKTF